MRFHTHLDRKWTINMALQDLHAFLENNIYVNFVGTNRTDLSPRIAWKNFRADIVFKHILFN